MTLMWGEEWYLPSKLEEFMLSGGFEKERLRMESYEIWHRTSYLKRWAQIVWSFLGGRGRVGGAWRTRRGGRRRWGR
jgi:hypothetical protein